MLYMLYIYIYIYIYYIYIYIYIWRRNAVDRCICMNKICDFDVLKHSRELKLLYISRDMIEAFHCLTAIKNGE